MIYKELETEIGSIYILEEDGNITGLTYDKQETAGIEKGSSSLLEKAERQLTEYFEGRRKSFDLPLELKGTDFQVKVWKALEKIPYGETKSYQEIAEEIGSPKAFRAVGNANNKNPVSIIIPCHRVIGKSGKLVGYGGGLEKKEYLLHLEEQFKNN